MNFDKKEKLAKSLETSIKELEKLAKDKDKEIRELVSENVNCNSEILSLLSEDKVLEIRENVAKHKNTSADILDKLSKDDSYIVRAYVSLNANTSVDTLKVLSKDENQFVKELVVKNENSTEDILNTVLDSRIQNMINSKENEYDTGISVFTGISSHKNCTSELLEKMIKYCDDYELEFVAKNPNCSKEILYELSNKQASLGLKLEIIKNPNTSLETLANMIREDNFADINSYVKIGFNKRLDELSKTTFSEHFDVNAFKSEPLVNAIKELDETLKKAEKDGLVFEPLNLEKENQAEVAKPDVGDKNSTDDGIDF